MNASVLRQRGPLLNFIRQAQVSINNVGSNTIRRPLLTRRSNRQVSLFTHTTTNGPSLSQQMNLRRQRRFLTSHRGVQQITGRLTSQSHRRLRRLRRHNQVIRSPILRHQSNHTLRLARHIASPTLSQDAKVITGIVTMLRMGHLSRRPRFSFIVLFR